MTIVEHKWSALPVPYAIEVSDRIPRQRCDDPDCDAVEDKVPWPLVGEIHPWWPPLVDLEL